MTVEQVFLRVARRLEFFSRMVRWLSLPVRRGIAALVGLFLFRVEGLA